MNKAPTNATVTNQDGAFSKGAGMTTSASTAASGNRPETIVTRRDSDGYRGSEQPIRKFGPKYKFHDQASNHPRIPKSAMTEVTQEAVPVNTPGNTNSASLLRP